MKMTDKEAEEWVKLLTSWDGVIKVHKMVKPESLVMYGSTLYVHDYETACELAFIFRDVTKRTVIIAGSPSNDEVLRGR